MNMDMFEQQGEEHKMQEAPLATRMRPTSLHTFVGQEHIIGPGRVLTGLMRRIDRRVPCESTST